MNKKGFSLPEMLIALGLLSVLAVYFINSSNNLFKFSKTLDERSIVGDFVDEFHLYSNELKCKKQFIFPSSLNAGQLLKMANVKSDYQNLVMEIARVDVLSDTPASKVLSLLIKLKGPKSSDLMMGLLYVNLNASGDILSCSNSPL